MLNWDKVTESTIKRVVFYGRVSTQHEAQLSAFENQLEWYNKELEKHEDWELAYPIETYLDKGITGTQAKIRPGFLKMIEDAEADKFDMIVTREVSRFARNTVDALSYVRKLKAKSVQVYFVHDNIKTIEDKEGELRLSLMATLAQEESRKISERVKAGQMVARNEGVLYGNGNILGYTRIRKRSDSDKKNRIGDKSTPTFAIDNEQAETVRMIFNLYKQGLGLKQVKNELLKAGRKNSVGQVKWHETTLSHILENPMYIGKQYQMKFKVADFVDHTIKKNAKSEYVLIDGDFEPIIDEETFYEVQRIKKSKLSVYDGKILGKKVSTDKWLNKLECACGSRLQLEKWNKIQSGEQRMGYVCRHKRVGGSENFRLKNGIPTEGSCGIPSIPSWKFDFMGVDIFKEIWYNKKANIVETFGFIADNYVSSNTKDSSIEKLQQQLDRYASKLDNLLEVYTDGNISKSVFAVKQAEFEKKIEGIKQELLRIESDNTDTDLVELKAVQETLTKMFDFSGEKLDEAIVRNYVDKVVINSKSDFDWFINLSGDGATYIAENIDLNKNISYEKRAENTAKMREEMYTLFFTMYFDYESAKKYRAKSGSFLKVNKWDDVLVKVYIRTTNKAK